MRIKNFTLMLLALLFAVAGFAQKSFSVRNDIAFNRKAQVQTLVKQASLMPAALAANQRSIPATRTVAKAPAKAADVVTPPEDGDLEYYTLKGVNSVPKSEITRTVKVIWDGDDDVYISGLSYYLPDAFVKGTFTDDETVVFAAGQYMGNLGVDVYFGAYGEEGLVDAVAKFNEETSTFTFSEFLLDNGDPEELGFYAYWNSGLTISPIEEDPEIPVEIPTDLEVETYAYTASDYFKDHAEVSGNLQIGFYGEDMYIQGMSTDYPEAWIKGTFVNDTTIVFPSGQLLTDERSLYFIAIDGNFEVVDGYELIYEPETGIFKEGVYAPMINAYKDRLEQSVWQFCYGYEIKKITEKAATPAKSLISAINYDVYGDILEFNLSKVDTEGEGLVADKLAYKLYYQTEDGEAVPVTFSKDLYKNLEEDATEIPAIFTDKYDFFDGSVYLNMSEHTSWTAIGLQGIYYGGGERNESEIAWYTPTWPQTITLPEALKEKVTEHTFKGETYSRGDNIPFEKTVGVAFDADTMYIRGIGEVSETAWVKGTKVGDAYVFPKGQSIGVYANNNNSYRLFLVGYADDTASDVVLKVDEANGVYEFEDDFLENANYTDKSYYFTYFNAGATISMAKAEEEVPEVVVVPEGLKTEVYSFTGTNYFDKTPVAWSANVGFDGDDVYVQGLSENVPEAWVKGTLADGVVTFATGQYLGGEDELWFVGVKLSNASCVDYPMTFDAETGIFTSADENIYLGVNAYKAKIQSSVYELYGGAQLKKIVEKAITPATPIVNNMCFSYFGDIIEFNIPVKDVDGDGLIESLLSYKLYYDNGDGEAHAITFTPESYEYLENEMTEIPYGFLDSVDDDGNPEGYDFYTSSVYLNMEHAGWKRIGLQTIYRGGGETHESEIGWYTITWPQITELPEGAEVKLCDFAGQYYTRNGNVDFFKTVNVAMVGDDVYIQGVGSRDKETWIKGTKTSDGSYTFVNGQYLGFYEGRTPGDNSYLFLMGYNATLGVLDVKMKYDAETSTFTTMTDLVENADYTDKLYYLNRVNAGAQIMPASEVAISSVVAETEDNAAPRYNIAGQRVNANFKGIVLRNGQKTLQK